MTRAFGKSADGLARRSSSSPSSFSPAEKSSGVVLYADASQPSAQASYATQAGLGAPAADPHGNVPRGPWLEIARAPPQQRPGHHHRLLEARPAVVERHAHRVVVGLRGARAEAGDDAALGEQVEGDQRLGKRHRSAQARQRDGRGELHVAGALEDGRQRDEPVEPGPREQEVVVGGDRGESTLPRGVDRARKPARREPFSAEVDQRQMDAGIHDRAIISRGQRRATTSRSPTSYSPSARRRP